MLHPAGKVIDWIFLYFRYLRPFKLVVKSSPSAMIIQYCGPKLILSFLNSKIKNLTKTCLANDLQRFQKSRLDICLISQ